MASAALNFFILCQKIHGMGEYKNSRVLINSYLHCILKPVVVLGQ